MRIAGILMPLSSLSSNHGIGDLGYYSYRFIDLLAESKSRIWQLLPLNPVGYGNSPYQPYSSFAGDEIYISLDKLYEEGLLKDKPKKFNPKSNRVDYKGVRDFKEIYLKKAYNNFIKEKKNKSFYKFIEQAWVHDYGVYLTLKKKNGFTSWTDWPKEEKNYIVDRNLDLEKYEKNIGYEIFNQYLFYIQWMELKKYANHKGIKIMGDIPFYVGGDSLDVWSNQSSFLLDKDGRPIFVAGVPPDYFSKTGQRWGNPIYDWNYLKENGYQFWIERIKYNAKLFDMLRIDHFRAFDTFWSIPSSHKTAMKGQWLEAPGYDVLNKIIRSVPDVELIAEDLGDLRPEVLELRDHFSLRGMLIAQYNFDSQSKNHDYMGNKNMLIYSGTHDNQTSVGWYKSHDKKTRKSILRKLKNLGYKKGSFSDKFINYILDSDAKIAILPIQDILGLGDEARMNTPGTLGSPNWEWKLAKDKKIAKKMRTFKDALIRSKRA